ncbi:reverse transcriptase domain-containing protein [Armatimonas sp.]|uniref:reverse transcriptase domain-containing protein n=1 Tax=Armatimonas sp. TaxID=1872638 RepID=UPI00375240E0
MSLMPQQPSYQQLHKAPLLRRLLAELLDGLIPLREQLRRDIPDRAVLRVISLWLEAGAMDTLEVRPSLVQVTAELVRGALHTVALSEEEEDPLDWERSSRAASLRRFGGEAARLAWDYRRLLLPALATKAALLTGGLGVAAVAGVLATNYALSHRRQRQRGAPQGSPLSPLLSNIYLHSFDLAMTQAGLRLVRYADDFVVCYPSEARARQAQDVAARELERLRLTLHPQKTRILSCRDPLEFLGHAFDDDGALAAVARTHQPVAELRRQLAGGAKAAQTGSTQAIREVKERFEELHKENSNVRRKP